jgi:hypothetical protein
MTSVLESSDTLNETWLDDEPGCQSAQGCSHAAEWNCVMRCCPASATLCTRCLIRSKEATRNAYITCAGCGHMHGYADYHQIVRVNPI